MRTEDRYDSLFAFYAERHGLPWQFIKAQAQAESGLELDPGARSGVGARGLAQFMSRTWEEWRDGTPGIQEVPPHELYDPMNPEAAIRSMCAYMAWILKRTIVGGDRRKALVAYNWGIGNLVRVNREYGSRWQDHIPNETHSYIRRIERYLDALKPEGVEVA